MADTIKPVTLDYLNYKILEHLADNARVPLSEIAAELKIATSTVHKRMQNMQGRACYRAIQYYCGSGGIEPDYGVYRY